mgnify:CR=1 FL=1
MPIIHSNKAPEPLGNFEELAKAASLQDNTGRPVSYKLIGEISDAHPLKNIINEMQDVSAPFLERIKAARPQNNDDIPVWKTERYILAKNDNIVIFHAAIAALAEGGSRVGLSCSIAELELKDDQVMIKNQLQQLDFADGSLETVKPSSIVSADAVFAKPFSVMVQLHKFMATGNDSDLKLLQASCKDPTFNLQEQQALIHSLVHEIEIEIRVESECLDRQNNLIKIFSIMPSIIPSIIPSIVAGLDKVAIHKEGKDLLEKCYEQFCVQHDWSLVVAAGLDKKYQAEKYQAEKYNLTYIFSNMMSFLLPLVSVLKLHMMHYCIVHLPLLLASTCGIFLASSYITALAAIASLATILLSYGFLQYVAKSFLLKLYGTEKYIAYKKFCYEVSSLAVLNDVARSLNAAISDKVTFMYGIVGAYYTLDSDQIIEEVQELRALIVEHGWMKTLQSAMLMGSLLCLLLPAYQLVCGITMLLGYAAFSYNFVIPKKAQIILATSGEKATAASSLFSYTSSAVKSYDVTAEFLGYKDTFAK